MRIWNERGHLERNWLILDAVRKVAEQRGVAMRQVAIAWVLGRPAVCSVIVGARTLSQLEDNLAAGSIHLSDEETRLLDEASEPAAPDYPTASAAKPSVTAGSPAVVSDNGCAQLSAPACSR